MASPLHKQITVQTGIFQILNIKNFQIDFIEISWLSRLMDIPFIFRGPDFWHPQSIGLVEKPF